jgi:hypothetical protein
MKKTLILAGILFLSWAVSRVSAQDNSNSGFGMGDDPRDVPSLGFRVGINASNIYDTKGDNFDYKSKVGLAAGAFLSLPLGKYIGLQPEVIYSQKGYKGSGSALSISYDYTRKADYIDVPLQLQIKPVRFVTLLVGPQYSFLIHKEFKLDSDLGGGSSSSDVDNDNIRKNILGLSIGADINLDRFVLSGRTAWDLQNNKGDGTSSSPRYRNFILQLTLGVIL